MTALALSAVLAAGVYFVFDGLTRPAAEPSPRQRHGVLDEYLVRAGLPGVTPRAFLLFALGTGTALALVAHALLGWGLVSLLAGALGLAGPVAYYVRRHERRRAAVQAALVDAVAQLRDAIRTGLSVHEALAGLARTGPVALRPEFARVVREQRTAGLREALDDARARVADPVFDVVAESLVLNDQVGGRNVSGVLDRLAHATREELAVQQELRAVQARNVLSARIVAAVPLVLLVVIRQVNPDYLAVFDDWAGQVVLGAAVASSALGYAAMLWTARLPGERRVLG
jgi:tight adherence protein B